MNTLRNDGSRLKVSKGCASKDECLDLWWQKTSQNSACSQSKTSNGNLAAGNTCTYCCAGIHCNNDNYPTDLLIFPDLVLPVTTPTTHSTCVSYHVTIQPMYVCCYWSREDTLTRLYMHALCERPQHGGEMYARQSLGFCKGDTPYCMTTRSSSRVIKSCGSRDECHDLWWQKTSQNPACMKLKASNSNLTTNTTCTYCCAGIRCNINDYPTNLLLFSDKVAPHCMQCVNEGNGWNCAHTERCGQGEVCYIQNLQLTATSPSVPDTYYHGGCISKSECPTVSHTSVVDEHGSATVVQGECCSSTDCNRDIMKKYEALTMCEVCQGSNCGPGSGTLSLCSVDSPLCMATVVNDQHGHKEYSKRCATESECDQKWLGESSLKSECMGFKKDSSYLFDFTCHYCCKTNDCNQDIVPTTENMYTGKH